MPTVAELRASLMAASDAELALNVEIEHVIAASGAESKTKPALEELGKKVAGLPVGAETAALESAVGGVWPKFFLSKSNPDSFTTNYHEICGAIRQVAVALAAVRSRLGRTPEVDAVTAEFRKLDQSVAAWKPHIDAARALLPRYRAAIDAKGKVQAQLDALVAANPALGKTADGAAAKQNRFNRETRFGAFGRVTPAKYAPDLNDPWKVQGGRYGFYYRAGELDGCRTAADVIQKLALQYEYFKGEDIVAIEFEVAVSFDKDHAVVEPPKTSADWAKLMGRLQDTNHALGQETSGGGAAERVVKGPVLQSVRMSALRRFPHVQDKLDGARQKLLDQKLSEHQGRKEAEAQAAAAALGDPAKVAGAIAALDAARTKKDAAEAALKALQDRIAADPTGHRVTLSQLKGAKDDAWKALQAVDGAYFTAVGKYDPDIRRRLSHVELLNVEAMLHGAKTAKEREFLEEQKKRVLAERGLSSAKDSAGGEHASIQVQAQGAQEVVSVDNRVTGYEEYTAFVRTGQDPALKGKFNATRGVDPADTGVSYEVKVGQRMAASNALHAIHPVDVRIETSGLATVKGEAADVGARAAAKGRRAGASAASSMPVAKGAAPFPDIIGNLVHGSVNRLFHNTAGRARAVDGSKDVLGATFDMAARKPRGEAISSDIARLRQIRTAESKLTHQFDRLEGAVQHARPLVSTQAAQLQASLAKLDAQLAALRGQKGAALADGAREVGVTLGEMAAVARRMGYRSAGTVQTIQRLVQERRNALARLASGLDPSGAASSDDHARLDQLGKQVPGLDKVIGKRAREERKQGGRGGSWGGAPRGGLGGKLGASALSGIGAAARRGDKRGLVETVAPGALAQFTSMRSKVNGLFEALRAKGHKPRSKNWFSSAASWVGDKAKKAVTPLAQVAKSAVSGASSLAKAVAAPVSTALSKAVQAGAKAAGGLAKAAVSAGTSLAKKTAGALGNGMKAVSSAVGNAAAKAWDAGKQAVRAVVQPVAGLAARTGAALKSAWHQTTGVVGAVAGKVRSGLSSAASWVGDKARKVGGALLNAAQAAGKAYLEYTPMGRLMKLGWDKFGKSAWDKTKSLASAAWSATKKVGKAVGGFIQSPAGQLLVSGLSMATSFVPGGMLVKAGIGAVMGGIEAYASGGDWKQVLAGAASGGLEGAVPFLKVGGVGKALVGAGKGMLQSAVSGDFSARGLAKGALGGAWDAAGGKLLGKMGVGGKALVGAGKGALDAALDGKTSLKELATGALGGAWDSAGASFLEKAGKGKGVRALTEFLDGKGDHKGALGKLQKVTQSGAIQKLYAAGKKAAPKVVKGAVWVYDKAGKLHNVLEKVQGGAEYLQSGLAQVTELAEWGAGKAGEGSALGGFLKKVGSASQWGNEKIGHGLEYVKKVDDVVVKAHGALGTGFEFLGIDADKEISRMRARQKRQRSHGDLKEDLFDRIDNRLHAANEKFMKKSAKARALGGKARTGALERVEALQRKAGEYQERFASSKWGAKILAGGEKLVNAGVWAHGQMQALNQAIGSLTAHGEAIRRGLQDAVLMTEGADPEAFGGSLAWVHKTALEWEQKVGEGLAFVEKVGGYTGAGQEYLGNGLARVGVEQERLDASGQRAKVYYGLERGEEGKTQRPGTPWAQAGEGEEVVAPWVLAHDKLKQRASAALSDKARAKGKAALENLEKWRQRTRTGAEWVSKFGHALEGEDAPKGGRLGRFDAAGRLLIGSDTGDRAADWEALLARRKAATEAQAGAAAPRVQTKPAPADLARDVAQGLESKAEQKAAEQARDVERTESEAEARAAQAHERTAGGAADEAEALAEVAEGDELPVDGLAELADEEGVVGGPDAPATPALPLVAGAEGAENDVLFSRVRFYLDSFAAKVDELMPQLDVLLGTDPDAAEGVFNELVRAGRMPETEIERLGNVVGADPYLGKGLAVLAARLAEIRSRIRPAAPEGESVDPGVDVDADAVEASTEEGAGEPVTPETLGLDVAAGAPGDAAYLGEFHEDTWIGSGGAARPIAEALASNFQFGDYEPEGPTLAGELGGLGAALSGLGESLQGAAGDAAGLGEAIGGAAGALGGLGGSVGELVGASENPLARIAAKGGEFGQWLQQGAASVGGVGKQVSAAGGRLSGFAKDWQAGGMGKGTGRAVGQLFRKGRSGGMDEGPAPVVDAGDYADAPQRLDYGVMGQMERFLGTRFGDVKIHTGKGADLITKRFDAEAVTIREHIFFAPGRFNPHSTDGRKLLAHELTHVAQRGRANLDTRTAESEAHKAEAAFGTPGMEILDLSQPEADFRIDMGGADQGPTKGPRTAKKDRSVSAESGAHDEGVVGEELLDRVGERVYELMLDDLENEFESR